MGVNFYNIYGLSFVKNSLVNNSTGLLYNLPTNAHKLPQIMTVIQNNLTTETPVVALLCIVYASSGTKSREQLPGKQTTVLYSPLLWFL